MTMVNVSFNAYYGYVRQHASENQQCVYVDGREGSNAGRFVASRHSLDDRRHHATAMEIDDNGFASGRNYSVIPEMPPRHICRLEVANGGQQHLPQQQYHTAVDSPWWFHNNRKRCSDERQSDIEWKRPRKGSGDKSVYRDAGNAKGGMEQVHHESSSLCIDMTDDAQSTDWPVDSCCWAAGNYSSISNPGYKHLLSNNGSKSSKGNTDYEKMLFETHGCSPYHHQRTLLSDNDHIEIEL